MDRTLSTSYFKYFSPSAGEIGEYLYNLKGADRQVLLRIFRDIDDEVFELIKVDPERMAQLAGLDLQKLNLIRQNDYYFFLNKFNHNQITDLQKFVAETFNKVKENRITNLFIDITKKDAALQFLNNASKCSNGELIELPAINYLKKTYGVDKKIFSSVQVRFIKVDGKVDKSKFFDIDLVIFDNKGQIEKIFSAKSHSRVLTEGEILKDIDRLMFIKNIPREGQPMRDFLKTSDDFKSITLERINNFQRIEVKFYDTTIGFTNKEVIMDINDFKKSIKSSYSSNDVIKIDPEVLGTNKEDLMKSSYQALKNKITKP